MPHIYDLKEWMVSEDAVHGQHIGSSWPKDRKEQSYSPHVAGR